MIVPCPKFVGGDCELATAGALPNGTPLNGFDVARLILAQLDAAFAPRGGRVWSRNLADDYCGGYGPSETGSPFSTDCLRHWASNGSAYYCDMSHLEACSAEALDARSYAAATIATLLAAEAARREAEAGDSNGASFTLSTHNADWLDPAVSSGTHFNVCVTRNLWDELFREVNRPALLASVASGIAAAIAFFGAGYLLPLADGTTIFSLSARAHHLSKLITLRTTEAFRRGVLNSRDEPHADDVARMHLIGFDLGPVSLALRCVLVQCLLAAAEKGFCGMILFDPVRALRSWSWGLDLRSCRVVPRAALADGRELTLPEFMGELAGRLLAMVEQGVIPEISVPAARELLPIVIELAARLEAGDLAACARSLDWAAKLRLLIVMCGQPGVRLGDAATRLADQDYGNTDPARGSFWRLWEAGAVDPLVSRQEADERLSDGPPESRAWGRGRLIRQFAADVTGANWSYVELRRSADRWASRLKVNLPRLDSLNRGQAESLLAEATSVADLERLLQRQTELAAKAEPVDEIEDSLAGVTNLEAS